MYRRPLIWYITARPDPLIHAWPASMGSPVLFQTGPMSHTVTRDRSSTRRDTSERAIAAWTIFTSILNMPPDSFTVPTCSILGNTLCDKVFHHILCQRVTLYTVSMRGVKVNIVLYLHIMQ